MTKVSSSGSLNDDYSNFIAISRYARWIDDEGRRETWAETVNRYATYMSSKLGDKIDDETLVELHNAILDQKIMPSMRALMTAGEALDRENIAGYNCAFVAVDNVRAFDEALYVLMNGTGLGFNVESAYVSKLPSMPPEFFDTETTIVVHDSKLGWAKAYKELIALLLQGQVPSWDLSKVRPAGAKLKTFGGRACLTGDTIVYKDRKKARGHNEITIADLYDLQNGEGKWKNKPNHFKQVKLRALSEKDGIFYRNNVLEVIDNGFDPVYEIVTENGYRIKATGNHRFMTSTGDYDFVDNFNVGDLIAVNGSKENKTGVCIDCNTSVSRRSIRCRPCANQNQIGDTALLTTARQRKECRDYLGSACERCGVSETRLTVHHQDKNPYNNDWSNLETLCEPCHQVHHANERSFGDPYSHKYLSFDEIISIEYAGVERVFDLAMEAPDHNFVANGFVSHNSGPQPLIDLFDFTVESFKRASGRKLKPIEVHDIMCKIAEVVVVGGVRRCLPSDAQVQTPTGNKSMAEIAVGDSIVSGGRVAKVSAKVDSGEQQLVVVKHKFGQSRMTPNHRIAVFTDQDNYTFKDAGLLEPGDKLVRDLAGYDGARFQTLGGHGNYAPVEVIEVSQDTVEQTWDIEVEGIHEFTADGLVTHNSALISMSDLDDFDMSQAKSGQWWEHNGQRALANNSAVYYTKPSVGQFFTEWSNLYESKSGERGIINMGGIRKHVSSFEKRDASKIVGKNPCSEINLRSGQFCVTPDTPLITEDGIVNIGDVQDKSVKVWNGNRWSSVTVRKTRENSELVRVTFSDGSYLDCTPDHRFSVKNRFESEWRTVQAKDLTGEKHSLQVQPTVIDRDNGVRVDDAYTIGFAVGDGCVYNGKVLIDLYGDKKIKCPVSGSRGGRTRKHGCSVDSVRVTSKVDAELVSKLKVGSIRDLHTWNKESVLEFFAGMADADGSATGTGGIRIYISDETRARDAQLVLTGVGIKSSVNLVQRAGAVTNKGVRKKDLWYLQITDASMLPTHRLDVSGGHDAKFRGKYQNIKSVEKLDYTSDVFCFNEPENHMAVFGNVLTFQCNLTEVVIDPTDTLDAIRHKVKMATILGTYQATLTDFKYVRPVWKKNTEEERLLGVSLTGIYGHKFMSGQETRKDITLPEFLRELYDLTEQVNAEWSEKFGIPASTALTTVKPSGTVSQLVGASSGIHPWYAPYYIRTVRGDNKDPLTEFLKAQGIPNEPDLTRPDDTTVFSFPIKAPDDVITSRELSAIDHLNIYCIYRENWTDHDVSVTINVREEEWPRVGAWVYDNFDRIGGVSFLPATDHTYRQAPYQAITEDEYNLALSHMPDSINWVDLSLYELEDSTVGNQTLACTGSSCELVDLVK